MIVSLYVDEIENGKVLVPVYSVCESKSWEQWMNCMRNGGMVFFFSGRCMVVLIWQQLDFGLRRSSYVVLLQVSL